MAGNFYEAFEEKYRGDRDLIKSRLRVYLPFVEPLLSAYDGEMASAIDLGCGRGEWLELLKESGFEGYGVDLDEGMLSACRDRGLRVAAGDAVETLKALPDESQVAVSGFHIAEHLQFSHLQVLVQESLRVLKPGGVLILETPNPENIVVATTIFYLDPTHQRPIPPLLLSFLPEFYGFGRTKILRLQETVSLSDEGALSMEQVLYCASADFAVVAQKSAPERIFDTLGQAFASEHGISLATLVRKYDRHREEAARAAATESQAAMTKALQAENMALQAESMALAAVAKAQEAELALRHVQEMMQSIFNSRSWRATAPLRWLAAQTKWFRS